MKRLLVIYILIAIISLVLQGCVGSEGDDYSKVHKMLAELETYTTTAEIIVRGNKMVGSYMVKQYFKYPDRYRLEVISPEDKKGKVTLYDGSKVWIHNPQIDQTYVMENFKEVEETGMFPGHFAKNLFSSEEAEYIIKEEGNTKYVVIKVEMPGGNNYRKYQILYIDRESLIPVKMEVLDGQGNVTVTVYYRDFKYNEKIDDRLFRKIEKYQEQEYADVLHFPTECKGGEKSVQGIQTNVDGSKS